MQVVSNKEELVVKLYQDGKTIREIAQQDGVENSETRSSDMKNKSKTTQALCSYKASSPSR